MFDRRAKFAWMLTCLLLIGGGIGFGAAARALKVYLTKEPVELRAHLDTIATRVGAWEILGEGRKLSVEMVESLGTDKYLDRNYTRETDGAPIVLQVHIAYYTGEIDAVPHVPDRCLVAGGFDLVVQPHNVALAVPEDEWVVDAEHVNRRSGLPYRTVTHRDPVTKRPVTVRMPVTEDGFTLRCSEYAREDQPQARIHAGYLFIANGGLAATPHQVQKLAFSKAEKHAYYCKVQFTGMGDRDFGVEEFAAEAGDLLSALLPELMRCLPDWAEVESAESSADAETSTDEG
jgi:hypothetical protein